MMVFTPAAAPVWSVGTDPTVRTATAAKRQADPAAFQQYREERGEPAVMRQRHPATGGGRDHGIEEQRRRRREAAVTSVCQPEW